MLVYTHLILAGPAVFACVEILRPTQMPQVPAQMQLPLIHELVAQDRFTCTMPGNMALATPKRVRVKLDLRGTLRPGTNVRQRLFSERISDLYRGDVA